MWPTQTMSNRFNQTFQNIFGIELHRIDVRYSNVFHFSTKTESEKMHGLQLKNTVIRLCDLIWCEYATFVYCICLLERDPLEFDVVVLLHKEKYQMCTTSVYFWTQIWHITLSNNRDEWNWERERAKKFRQKETSKTWQMKKMRPIVAWTKYDYPHQLRMFVFVINFNRSFFIVWDKKKWEIHSICAQHVFRKNEF